MRNSSSLDWLRFMHTPNDYRVSRFIIFLLQMYKKSEDTRKFLALFIIISVFIYMATCCDSNF